MTNFEKFKKELTIDDLVKIICKVPCSDCPVYDSCNEGDGRTCKEKLTQYYKEEAESEVEDD